jgi:hypothetical protein
MEIICIILILLGLAIALVYGIQLIILAFQESVLWGLGYLFVPFVSLVFIIVFWSQTKGPFLKSLLCISCLVFAVLLSVSLQQTY